MGRCTCWEKQDLNCAELGPHQCCVLSGAIAGVQGSSYTNDVNCRCKDVYSVDRHPRDLFRGSWRAVGMDRFLLLTCGEFREESRDRCR